jgi:hypothetical protein
VRKTSEYRVTFAHPGRWRFSEVQCHPIQSSAGPYVSMRGHLWGPDGFTSQHAPDDHPAEGWLSEGGQASSFKTSGRMVMNQEHFKFQSNDDFSQNSMTCEDRVFLPVPEKPSVRSEILRWQARNLFRIYPISGVFLSHCQMGTSPNFGHK